MEDNQSQSYDQARLEQLKNQIQVSKAQLLQLAYSEELLYQKIDAFNNEGCQRINRQLYYEALVYYSQAEKVLEYAASCGRTIDRALIITTLHNEAAAYQRIWELIRSADYIQAIIYNINNVLNTDTLFIFAHDVIQEGSVQNLKFADYLTNKLSLISYHLQYCAVSSQIKNHTNALNSAQKALLLLKTYCEELHMFENMLYSHPSNHFEKTLLLQLQNIRDFQNETKVEIESYNQKLMYKAKKSIVVFQKKMQSANNLTRGELKQLQNFSLGQLMQVGMTTLKKVQEKVELKVQLTFIKKVFKAIYISIAHFTMATELRLIASQKYGDSVYRKQSKQFKESQAHHLIAIITTALYVPCVTKYFEHILNSFKNHYQIDINQIPQVNQDKNLNNDDLVHLEIQSVSNKDSQISQKIKLNDQYVKEADNQNRDNHQKSRRTDKSSLYLCEKGNNFTINAYSSLSSQNSKLKRMNRTGLSQKSQKSGKKSKRQKSKQTKTKQTKKIIIVEKIVSKSKSKGKGDSKKNQSNRSRHENSQQQEKIVHYFQYDNYTTKKVFNKDKSKSSPSDFLKRLNKPLRDKKTPENGVCGTMQKLTKCQSKRELTSELPIRMFKKCKSPELKTVRSPANIKKNK